MKQLKKRPTKQLEKYSTVIMQLSLVLVLFIVFQVFEHKTEQKPTNIIGFEPYVLEPYLVDEPLSFVKEKEVKKIMKSQKVTYIIDLDNFKKNEDKIKETLLKEKLPTDEVIKNEINEAFNSMIPVDTPVLVDYSLFISVEKAPVFKGCEGLAKTENKKCFAKKIQKFVITKFNADLAQELGLRSGKHKMYAQFIIDKKGNVVDVQVKAPHKRLKKEVTNIVKKLPKFTPGMMQEIPVNVKFTLPITFYVE
ncbi:MAG: energy transducer TonB [Polaribacter sp.]|nr:energy transducer TonB [Polaribacter sp.]